MTPLRSTNGSTGCRRPRTGLDRRCGSTFPKAHPRRAWQSSNEDVRGVEPFLTDLRADLKAGRFTPLPVRKRMIPKSSGKLRRLGIPTVRDRVVQAALKLVLEPIFEADFQPCSHGFRPRHRAQDAIAEIHQLTHTAT